ncbi:MAG TPA: carboxypeptidase-like regulatory domain-containing protein, partial [Terriglobales bacterium]
VETGEPMFFYGRMEEGSDAMVLRELGSQYAPVFYPGVLQLDQAQAVTLGAGEEAHADVAMRRMKLVEVGGRVIGPDGSPPVRSFVRLSLAGVEDWGGELGGGTDSKGEFSVKGVPAGSYFVTAGSFEKGKFYNTRQKVEVGEANVDSLVLVLGGGVTIHGRLVTAGGAPVPSGRVRVGLESTGEEGGSGSGYTDVNKDGSFEIDGVADGSYILQAGGFEQGWFVKSAHLGSEDVLLAGVQVENGAVAGRLDIVVSSESAQIEGTVTDGDQNQPLVGVQLRARPDPETDYNRFRSPQTTTDQNGHFVLKDIPPGKYKVTAKMPSSGNGAPAIKSDPVSVTLGEREHRALDFKLKVPKSE